jgi:uncharacterized membrane protein
MERPKIIYCAYVALLLLFTGLIAFTPYIAFSDMPLAKSLYSAFEPTCHQKISRSLCLFGNGSFPVGDCTPQNGAYVGNDRANLSAVENGALGYKFPVCSRDIGIYLAMLLGALAYPLAFKIEEKKILPAIILIAAMVPIGIDGTVQLLSDMGIYLLGFPYESTNLVRLLTGGLAGFVASFYVIPILNRMFG